MIAPVRGERPGSSRRLEAPDLAATQGPCPFCPGRESETPPETLALAGPGRAANAPGWRLRVVPNRFPAFGDAGLPTDDGLFARRPAIGRQEVVVHTPRHLASLADLTSPEIDEVARAWRSRAEASRRAGFSVQRAIANEGPDSGATLAHTHSQLIALPRESAARLAVLGRLADGPCLACAVVAEERRRAERIVVDDGELVAHCPWASRQPYEVRIAPVRCEPDAYASDLLAPALALAAECLRRIRGAAGGWVPVNVQLATSPLDAAVGHWWLEVVPRLTVPSMAELQGDVGVNPVPPELAAARLRGR